MARTSEIHTYTLDDIARETTLSRQQLRGLSTSRANSWEFTVEELVEAMESNRDPNTTRQRVYSHVCSRHLNLNSIASVGRYLVNMAKQNKRVKEIKHILLSIGTIPSEFDLGNLWSVTEIMAAYGTAATKTRLNEAINDSGIKSLVDPNHARE